MTSLTDVYEGHVGRLASRRQKLLGTGLFLAGAAMIVSAIGVATTQVGVDALGRYGARELAGVLAGVGLQGVVLGVFAVLPAARHVRAAALIGASVSLLGVALFRHAYPYDWVVSAPLLALASTAVYVFGVVTTFWCLFAALATVETRNDPGGTARMEITESGTIELVEEARSLGRFGGIAMFGDQPDGDVETQTNHAGDGAAGDATVRTATPTDDGAEVETASADAPGLSGTDEPEPTADGGSATIGAATAGNATGGEAAFLDAVADRGRLDAYCGNCEHFEYVSTGDDIAPYCGLADERMDDMDACEEWSDQSNA